MKAYFITYQQPNGTVVNTWTLTEANLQRHMTAITETGNQLIAVEKKEVKA